MNDDEEELPTATALIRYEWDCPECGETNEVPYGADYDEEECTSCNVTVKVTTG